MHVFYQHDVPNEVIAEDGQHQFKFHLNHIETDQDFKVMHQQCCDVVMLYNLDSALESSMINRIQSLKHLPLVIISKIFHLQRKIELVKQGIDEFFHIEEDVTYIKFKLKNLLQRIQVIKHLQAGTIEFQHLSVNFSERQVYIKNKRINITVKEFEILQLFLANPNITLSKEEIFYHLWHKDLYYSDNIINVHIRHLRKKIELNDKKPLVIETVWGYGYKLGQGEIIQNQ